MIARLVAALLAEYWLCIFTRLMTAKITGPEIPDDGNDGTLTRSFSRGEEVKGIVRTTHFHLAAAAETGIVAADSRLGTLWTEFMDASPTNSDLCNAIRTIEPVRMEAWQTLLAQGARNEDLRFVIECVEPLRVEAAHRLLTQRPAGRDLCCVIVHVKRLRPAAWRMLLDRGVRNDDLRYIIEFVEPLRLEAARMLLTRATTSDDLGMIIKCVPSLTKKATQMLWLNEKRQYLLDRMRETVASS